MSMKLGYLLPGAFAVTAVLGSWQVSRSTDLPPAPPASAKNSAKVNFAKDVLPFLTKHCYHCHGNGKKRGELSLDPYKDETAVQKDRKVWERVLEMLRAGEMPPEPRPRPDAAAVEATIRSVEAVLADVDCSRPNAGRVTLRRLNRVEYNNTIRDLVGIDFKPAEDFPADDVGYGFDNIGDVLSLSPLLLEKYLAAAETVLDQAIVLADPPKPMKNRLGGLRVSPRNVGEVSRYGAVLRARGDASAEVYLEEGDYVIRAEVYGKQAGDEPVRAGLRVNRDDPTEFDVKAEESAPATLEMKVRLRGGTTRVAVSFLNSSTSPTPAPEAKGQGEGKPAEPKKPERQLIVRSILVDGPYNPPAPQVPESHRRLMQVADARSQVADRLAVVPIPLSAVSPMPAVLYHLPGLQSAIGNLQSAIRRDAAREVVVRFATRAFRRPVQPGEVERCLKLYDQAEQAGERFEDRVRLALYRVLVSPHFLFRVELDPPGAKTGTAYPINEYELASRLSYFFWSSMPDEELFGLAARGELRKNLDGQVRRMMKDPKSAAFVQNFAGQWLTLRKLETVSPDPKTFPSFDAELRAAMQRETELLFEAVLREDRSVLDLLDVDFTFVNERLAKHYGIDGVKGKEFRRVKLPAHRGGILTQASILTLTSNPTRTSPVKRGKWVLEQILNTPPPPPPPDVPELSEEKQLTGSLRQVMEQHRSNAICASCHQRMDPIGFAFENFDAVGRWRDKDGNFPIDPSGVLPDGKTFQGPAELKAILKGKKELFGRCLIEKVLTYALGRGLEHYDQCAVDRVLEALDKNAYRFSSLLLEVVKSEPFQLRTATGAKP